VNPFNYIYNGVTTQSIPCYLPISSSLHFPEIIINVIISNNTNIELLCCTELPKLRLNLLLGSMMFRHVPSITTKVRHVNKHTLSKLLVFVHENTYLEYSFNDYNWQKNYISRKWDVIQFSFKLESSSQTWNYKLNES